MNHHSDLPNFSPAQLDLLLAMTSKKMGTTPEKLKNQLQNGDLPAALSGTNLSQLLNDPQKIEQLLRSEKAQAILRELMK